MCALPGGHEGEEHDRHVHEEEAHGHDPVQHEVPEDEQPHLRTRVPRSSLAAAGHALQRVLGFQAVIFSHVQTLVLQKTLYGCTAICTYKR